MSYYKGKLYLYFGVTPALVLFWPYAALTGNYLLQKNGVVVFCFVGFVVSAGLLFALWRRYFAEVRLAVVAAGTLALGLATSTPWLLARCDAHEVSISCGYAFTMLALGALWKALHYSSKRSWWLAAASLAYGLAVGARPSLLFGAVILLAPVAQVWRERRPVWAALMAASGPIMLIGLGLMLYNAGRFDSPFEFGYRYQLAGDRMLMRPFFSLQYLWFNFRVYFLEPARWSARFPFVHDIVVPPLPAGYIRAETPFGVLTNIPLVWLALAVPLAWRNRSGQEGSILCWFVMSVALLFGICAFTVSLFCGAAGRYEVDFLPALVLLGVVGILGLERALAYQPVWQRAVRSGWILLVVFSVAFNLFASVGRCAEAHNYLGFILRRTGQTQEEVEQYEQALRLNPDYAEAHNNLGTALDKMGKVQEAIEHYGQALRIRPSYPEAHYNLGVALEKTGRAQEAIGHYEVAVRIKSDFTEAHYNLGIVLLRAGRVQEAIGHYEQVLRLKPDYAEAHNNLGTALERDGRTAEAIEQYRLAVRLKPDYAEAHHNLGVALLRLGRTQEAVADFEQAVRLKPDDASAHDNLGVALAVLGNAQEAMEQWEDAVRLKPDDGEAQCNLGIALERDGRVPEAIEHYEQALKLNPGFAPARNALARLQTRR
jgi:tetratricopeptide (TPR) repeat protein